MHVGKVEDMKTLLLTLLVLLLVGAAFVVSETQGWTDFTTLSEDEDVAEPGEGEPEPSAAAPEGVDEVMAMMEANGLPCEDEEPGATYASVVEESLRCTIDDTEVTILTFEDEAAQLDWLGSDDIETETIEVAGEEFSVATGPNWVVLIHGELNEELAARIEG